MSDAELATLLDLATVREESVSDFVRRIVADGLRTRTGHPRTRKGKAA